jgi:hypothetical protein
VEVLALVGIPFAVVLVAFVLVGNAIGGSAAGPDAQPWAPVARGTRVRRIVLVVAAAGLAALGAGAAAAGGAFSQLMDQGYAIEPSALVFALEAGAGLALTGVVALGGWSPRRAWILRAIGLYWLCVAGPALILADTGAGWISLVDRGRGSLPLGLAPFPFEVVAALMPAVLIWIASLGSRETSQAVVP